MAYVVWRVLSAVLAFYTNSKGLYMSSHQPWRPDRFYLWLALSNSATQVCCPGLSPSLPGGAFCALPCAAIFADFQVEQRGREIGPSRE